MDFTPTWIALDIQSSDKENNPVRILNSNPLAPNLSYYPMRGSISGYQLVSRLHLSSPTAVHYTIVTTYPVTTAATVGIIEPIYIASKRL